MCTSCPSPTPFGLGLGPTDPGPINVAQETLDLRRAGFSPAFTLLVPEFALVQAPHGLPFVLRRHSTRPVSYYALFQGWLLLSQPPGCLCLFLTIRSSPRFTLFPYTSPIR